jgi:hypothetical protein
MIGKKLIYWIVVLLVSYIILALFAKEVGFLIGFILAIFFGTQATINILANYIVFFLVLAYIIIASIMSYIVKLLLPELLTYESKKVKKKQVKRNNAQALAGILVLIIAVVLILVFLKGNDGSASNQQINQSLTNLPNLNTTSQTSTIPISSTSTVVGVNNKTTITNNTFTNTTKKVKNSYFIYCTGGQIFVNGGPQYSYSNIFQEINTSYYANVSSGGIQKWVKTSSYPTSTYSLPSQERVAPNICTTYNNTEYCVNGYYASLSTNGIGTWRSTSAIPNLSLFPNQALSCIAYNSYIYCVTGFYSNQTYFASLSSNGIGKWSTTTLYPLNLSINSVFCTTNNGEIYCMGGVPNTKIPPNYPTGQWYNVTYYNTWYASLSNSGIGSWSYASASPYDIDPSRCIGNNSSVYCVSTGKSGFPNESTEFTYLYPTGTSLWYSSTSYPVNISIPSCTSINNTMYCIGGATVNSGQYFNARGQSYYSKLSSLGLGSWYQTLNYPLNISSETCMTDSFSS